MGFGEFVDKEKMACDKLFPAKNCFSAFIKKDIKQLEDENLQSEFFKLASDKDCNIQSYTTNYDMYNKEASRLYAELLLCVCWHTEHI